MRKLLFGGLILLAILAVAGLTVKWVLTGYLTPDFLVRQIERQWNCRAHIDDVDVRLLGKAAVEIKGLALAPRDELAAKKSPLKDRPALDPTTAEFRGDTVLLEIRPMELIRRELNIRQLTVSGLSIVTRINRDGDASFEQLFERVPKDAEPDLSLAVTETETASRKSPFAMVADRVEVKDGRADFTVESSGATIRLENFQIALTDIDIDPGALAAHNRALFQFGGELSVVPPTERGTTEHFRGRISGSGEATPFDLATGRMDPVWATDLTLHQGAQIDTFPVIRRLQELIEGVDTAGVDLKDLQLRGTLLADAHTRIAHAAGKYTFEKPLNLPLPDTTLIVTQGSWFDTGTNRHEFEGKVVASDDLTKKIAGKVDTYLTKKTNGLLEGKGSELVLGPLMEEGRLAIQFTSKGDLANPKADIVTPFGNLSEVIKGGKDTLKTLEDVGKSLLKNLFGK